LLILIALWLKFTDYLQWVWLDDKSVRAREALAFPTDLESRAVRINPDRAKAVSTLLQGFFSSPPQGVGSSDKLALALAARSKLLRDFLAEELLRQSREKREGRLYALFEVFRTQVFHELSTAEFADAFAQMLAYGLFLARLNAGAKGIVTLENVRGHIPGSFRLIRELVRFLEEMQEDEYRPVRWIVEEVLSIVNAMDLASIQQDLSFRARKSATRGFRAGSEEEHRLFERDPFIYFYEDYLKAYDPAMRKGRGVYYTPPPIVNFIVRAVDDLLKGPFQIEDGLADPKRVTVLDFACGTGTFLLEVFERIFDNIGGSDSGRAELIVREHMLANVNGFEYLIAPYTIAHLKLSQYLRDKGHPLSDNSRLQVFLTNTLEPIAPQKNLLMPALAEEAKAAQEVKDKPILVILGNPPYSGHSKNNGAWIKAAIDDYKFMMEDRPDPVTGELRQTRVPLGERNSKWLNDDYVKFIRFAQIKMNAVEEGVVGIITNHSWLDNPTFRGMRQSLMRSFDQIYVLDLHGNAKKKERAPDGGKDENVFDIEQGVAISLFVKRKGLEKGVWRGDLWGSRLGKYQVSYRDRISATFNQQIKPREPHFLFRAINRELEVKFQVFKSITEIFESYSLGSLTKRDNLVVSMDKSSLLENINFLRDPKKNDEFITDKFGVRKEDNDGWSITKARDHARNATLENSIININWRPFDKRWIIFDDTLIARTNRRVLSSLLEKKSIALVAVRQLASLPFFHAFVSDNICDQHYVSTRTKEGGVVFPLHLKTTNNENLTPDFRAFIDARYDHVYTPEDILGYIYAVLHAPIYRSTYADFLRIDFPRIPFPERKRDFEALSELGWRLVQVHLMREKPKCKLAAFHGKGTHEVDEVAYSEVENSVRINAGQCFKPVPQAVWDFHIGGYRVVEKYLKSRKGRRLTLDEIDHFAATVKALAFTIEQMGRIDLAYCAAFGSSGKASQADDLAAAPM
jgi:predicted helicase